VTEPLVAFPLSEAIAGGTVQMLRNLIANGLLGRVDQRRG